MSWVGEPGLREYMSSSIFPVNPLPPPHSVFLYISDKGKAERRAGTKQAHLLLQSKYHVTYFGETVSRAWIPVSMLKNFQELSLELARVVSKLWGSAVIQGTGHFCV